MFFVNELAADLVFLGENEPNASEDRGALEAVAEHGRFANYFQ